MTTIAVDAKGFVAADGMRVWSGDVVGRNEKKLRVRYGRIYALTGTAAAFEPLIEWHNAGADPEKTPKMKEDDAWSLIVIARNGAVGRYSQSCPYVEYFDPPIAFGAGADMAEGAMLHGASAEEAVRIVAARTNHTGGEIQVYNIRETLIPNEPVREAAE